MSRIGDFADDDAAAWITRSPDIGIPMAGFTNAVYNKNRLPLRTRELARMVIALDNECVVCQNTRDSAGIAAGVDEDLYDHAAEW
jgi:AhpD family alkylhydroperoxidase